MNKIAKQALLHALGTTAYIVLVASFMFYVSHTMRNTPDTILAPITLMLLLVMSAAITGFLVFGRPAMLYIEGKKKDALSFLGYTLGFLCAFTVIAIIILFSLHK